MRNRRRCVCGVRDQRWTEINQRHLKQNQCYLSISRFSLSDDILMKSNQCLGCRNHFFESELLAQAFQSPRLALFDFGSPLTQKQLLQLKKEVVAMLNSQGGVILSSVDSDKCLVGLPLTQNQQVQYRNRIQLSMRNIFPSFPAQQVKINFVPIVNQRHSFSGKYQPVLLVRKGLSNELYMFSNIIQIRQYNKISIFNVVSACLKRSDKVQVLKSKEIQEEIAQRYTRNPYDIDQHHTCDPLFLDPALAPTELILRGQSLELVRDWVQSKLRSMQIKHLMCAQPGLTRIEFSQLREDLQVCSQIILNSKEQIKQYFALSIEPVSISQFVFSRIKPKVQIPVGSFKNSEPQQPKYFLFSNFSNKKSKNDVLNMLKRKKKFEFELEYDGSMNFLVKFTETKQFDNFKQVVKENKKQFNKYGFGERLNSGQFEGRLQVGSFVSKQMRDLFIIYLKNLQFRDIKIKQDRQGQVLIQGEPKMILQVHQQLVLRKHFLKDFLEKMPKFILLVF